MSTLPELEAQLKVLEPDQVEWVARIAAILCTSTEQFRRPGSHIIPDDRALRMFGDTLKVHHGLFAAEPFRRERFEYALRRIAAAGGREVERPGSATHPGYDVRVDGERWSLKTQANSAIRRDLIWVSKWMELGKGVWGNRAKDLVALREAFRHRFCLARPALGNLAPRVICFRSRPQADTQIPPAIDPVEGLRCLNRARPMNFDICRAETSTLTHSATPGCPAARCSRRSARRCACGRAGRRPSGWRGGRSRARRT